MHLSNKCILLFGGILAILNHLVLAQYYLDSPLKPTKGGLQGELKLRQPQTSYPSPISLLSLNVEYWTDSVIRVTLDDPSTSRWRVPFVLQDRPPIPSSQKYRFQVVHADPFQFAIIRTTDNVVIWNSTRLVFNDQYLEIGTQFNGASPNIYGFGERVHNFRLDERNRSYVMWNMDQGTPVDKNLYGTHPFYLQFDERSRSFFGAFMLNSNAMDVLLTPEGLKYRMIGGIIDMFFFIGPNANQVLQQYQKYVIGTPKMIPFWSLGFHQCRWGYKNVDALRTVIDKYRQLSIPTDVAWNDIDYMDAYKDFTTDPVNYPTSQLKPFIDQLHSNNQRYVVIIDPGIKIEPGYAPYDEGLKQDLYIKDSTGKNLVNKVWPGLTVFVDWTNSGSYDYWEKQIAGFLKQVPVDGLWIDMNEIAGFCDGSCPTKSHSHDQFDPVHPPYVPGNINLIQHTISIDAVHNMTIEYNIHNLYGFIESIYTSHALEKLQSKRSFVLTRSTYAGSGHYVQHWLGDNSATWDDMFYSISGILSMQLFGIPMAGVDIGGFNMDSNAELMARWVELGAFYPFTRNHNTKDASPQEFYVFGDQVVSIAKQWLLVKYSLASYYYTLFWETNQAGGSVIRPIFFEFPMEDHSELPYLDRLFLVGPALLVTPVLSPGQTSVTSYLPGESTKTLWFDFLSGAPFECKGFCGMQAPLDKINVHLRGGYGMFLHDVQEGKTLTTHDARMAGFKLLMAIDVSGKSEGSIYIDDGESIQVKDYYHIGVMHQPKGSTFSVDSQVISGSSHHSDEGLNISLSLNGITLYGVHGSQVSNVKVNGKSVDSFRFDSSFKRLDIDLSNISIKDLHLTYEAQ